MVVITEIVDWRTYDQSIIPFDPQSPTPHPKFPVNQRDYHAAACAFVSLVKVMEFRSKIKWKKDGLYDEIKRKYEGDIAELIKNKRPPCQILRLIQHVHVTGIKDVSTKEVVFQLENCMKYITGFMYDKTTLDEAGKLKLRKNVRSAVKVAGPAIGKIRIRTDWRPHIDPVYRGRGKVVSYVNSRTNATRAVNHCVSIVSVVQIEFPEEVGVKYNGYRYAESDQPYITTWDHSGYGLALDDAIDIVYVPTTKL